MLRSVRTTADIADIIMHHFHGPELNGSPVVDAAEDNRGEELKAELGGRWPGEVEALTIDGYHPRWSGSNTAKGNLHTAPLL